MVAPTPALPPGYAYMSESSTYKSGGMAYMSGSPELREALDENASLVAQLHAAAETYKLLTEQLNRCGDEAASLPTDVACAPTPPPTPKPTDPAPTPKPSFEPHFIAELDINTSESVSAMLQ